MLLPVLLLAPPILALRVGYLSTSDSNERAVLKKCLPKKRFELVTLPACQNFSGIENGAILQYTHNVDVIVSDECDEELETLTKLSQRWKKLFVSLGQSHVSSVEPSTITFSPNNPKGFAHALLALSEYANWKQMAFVYSEEYEKFAEIAAMSVNECEENVNVTTCVRKDEEDIHVKIAENARVIFIVAHPSSIDVIFRTLFTKLHSIAEFIFVFVDYHRLASAQFYAEISRVLQEEGLKSRYIRNVLMLSSVHFDQTIVRDFAFSNQIKVTSSLENRLLLCDVFSTIFSLNHTSTESLFQKTTETRRNGYSGPISFSPDGIRLPVLKLFGYHNGRPEEIALLQPSESLVSLYELQPGEFLGKVFASLPPAVPECGFSGEHCSVTHIFLIAAVVVCIVSIPLAIAFYLQRKEDELIRMPWRVGYEKLHVKQEEQNPGYRRISAMSSVQGSLAEEDFGARKIGYVENTRVTMQLKHLNHSNVNPFIGITFNQNAETVVIWNYCIRGSLDDVLFGAGKRLGRNFQSTFLKHILHGLKYIHNSPIKTHGALFLTNCVVDSYWVVRLTDFGLNQILKTKMDNKEIINNAPIDLDVMPKKFLQLAPEHLSIFKETKDFYALNPSVEGDIYQFGMLMYQILFYRRPFRERREELEAQIEMICDGERKIAVRPIVMETKEFNMRLLSIMQQCWVHKMENRPPLFKIIDAVAREFGHSAKGTLIDQMITMIDEYSANLEEIVAERTKELEEMQEKTEALLYRLMPKQIANSLREGTPVRPQLHVAVSVLVVDVCRFTALCESCIPEHIIDILQELYSSFDQVISRFNAFKVENVGDAYLVVSGIPELQNHGHLSEVCRISLELSKLMSTFVAGRRPDFKMQVKIGISSGAVASGILGSLSPRFCIFGDTVNMACRMAATSLPDKIQITEQAQAIVAMKFTQFVLEERGIVDLKVTSKSD